MNARKGYIPTRSSELPSSLGQHVACAYGRISSLNQAMGLYIVRFT